MATVETEVDVESGLDWKSPLRKLVKFFQGSRNRWKAKYAAKKQECKLLSNQVRAVEKSRAKWRQDAEQAQQQVRELQHELEQYKKSPA
jgi:chromosome segregation ATPase